MIIERRVFQAKVGQADAVVAQIKAIQPLVERFGGVRPMRIYTDFLSGRTDRVVAEWEMDSLGEYERLVETLMQNAEALKAYETWYGGLKPLIEGAAVELGKREV